MEKAQMVRAPCTSQVGRHRFDSLSGPDPLINWGRQSSECWRLTFIEGRVLLKSSSTWPSEFPRSACEWERKRERERKVKEVTNIWLRKKKKTNIWLTLQTTRHRSQKKKSLRVTASFTYRGFVKTKRLFAVKLNKLLSEIRSTETMKGSLCRENYNVLLNTYEMWTFALNIVNPKVRFPINLITIYRI